MTCKDCVHYELCQCHRDCAEHFELAVEKFGCNQFKDKSRFIELPCKVGDMIYYISFGKIYAGKCHCVSVHNEVQIHFYDFDGDNATLCAKDIFLTREEAEKALKEKNYDL